MGEDITSIKSGQKPFGVDVPRRIAPDMPKAPEVSKPETPASSGPMRSFELGRTEKTGPLAELPKPVITPDRPGPTVGLGQGEKAGHLLPRSAPLKPIGLFKPPAIQPSVTVPGEKNGLNMLFYSLIAGGILIAGGAFYWFYLRPIKTEVVLSPTPTPIVTPTPAIRNLSDIFKGEPVNFEIKSSENVNGDFKIFVNTLTIANGDFLKINLVQDVGGSIVSLNWLDMFDIAIANYPSGLKDGTADSATLVYGQSEKFNKDGTVNSDVKDLKKTAFIARITDAVKVETLMKDWELTITNDLAGFLLIGDTSKEESVNFLNNTYRGVAIRYKNFPFPDTTVDYAIAIVESAGQNYLIITGSREAIYAAIDVLLAQ